MMFPPRHTKLLSDTQQHNQNRDGPDPDLYSFTKPSESLANR